MSDRPIVNLPDLQALVTGSLFRHAGEPVQEWFDREGIDPGAVVSLSKFLTGTWLISGAPPEALAIQAFQIGWDAHHDLRGETNPTERE